MRTEQDALLTVRRLNVSYETERKSVLALSDVSLTLHTGEIVAILGESGSGKSTLARALVGLVEKGASLHGDIAYGSHTITDFVDKERERLFARLRGKVVASVFQETSGALHPLLRLSHQMRDVMRTHEPQMTSREIKDKTQHIFALLNLPERAASAYPHELSGGQRQRASLALALAARPSILIADEICGALDDKTRRAVLDIINALALIEKMGIIYITHEVDDIRILCAKQVMVMYAGEWVEVGSADLVAGGAVHPYTRRLLACDPVKSAPQTIITAGERVTSPLEGACPYYSACPRRTGFCRIEKPILAKVGTEHYVRCHYVETEADE